MRADALRNRKRLLEVAMTRFSRDGFDAPLEAIAADAGVGIATLYRHFPSRTALVRALIEDELAPIAQTAAQAVASDQEPMAALRSLLEFGAERHTTDLALAQLWRTVDNDVVMEAVRATGLYDDTQRLLEPAQASGAIRGDVTVEDVARIFYAISGVVEAGNGAAWRRVLEIHLRGMAAAGPPLPEPVRPSTRGDREPVRRGR